MVGIEQTSTRSDVERAARGLLPFVGRTPLIRLGRITRGHSDRVEVYAKAEWFNPAGSVKDRPAREILLRALESGALAGRTLLDSTSGNMGIAYSTFAVALGIRVHLAIPANAGPARIGLLRALGAELTLTDPLEGSDGARQVAAEVADRQPERYAYVDQYSNPANWEAHYQTTGPEIWEQSGRRLTAFVAGLGTTGTMTGVGRYLHQVDPSVRLIGVQPDGPLHGLEGLKHLPTSPVPPIYDASVPDEVVPVSTESAYEMAGRLAREEGLLVSASAAAAAVAALRLADQVEVGVIVALFPDSGLKYLDGPPWRPR